MKNVSSISCVEFPHRVVEDGPNGVAELIVNGRPGDFHPCHMNPDKTCKGSMKRLTLIQAGAPINHNKVHYTSNFKLD